MAVDPAVLQRYMETFVGFGSFRGDFWFVGMEQGGGKDLEELQQRLEAWQTVGCAEVVDLHAYLNALQEHRWHGATAKYQPTLAQMARIVLAARQQDTSLAAVKAYQGLRLGTAEGETLVAELMPLPSRSVRDWVYSEIEALPQLQTRKSYRSALTPLRMGLLRDRIDEYKPPAVVFFGSSYMKDWSTLMGSPLVTRADLGVAVGQRGETRCVVARHPTSFGVTPRYFERIGELLR